MDLRHWIVLATLVGFAPTVTPVIAMGKVEAAQTVKKKKKKVVAQKKVVVQRTGEPRVKKNFGAPRPGEPNAGWTDDCLFYYDLYGALPNYCQPYGHGFRMWD
jgi:hypothetical protein